MYRISDFLYLLIYHLIGYRKSVVVNNISNSFPDKSPQEIKRIASLFYQHLCDLIVETIKMFSISKEELIRRCKVRNPELLQQYFDQGKSIIIPGGHYANWEMTATATDIQIAHQAIGAYSPLKDRFMNDQIRKSRSRFGLKLVPIQELKNFFSEYDGMPMAMIFGSDQSPRNVDKAYWTNFLNQDTGVMFGTEKYAHEYDYPVIYGKIDKLKRGYYEFEFILITDQPKSTRYGEISEAHTRILEKAIIDQPEYWLWSHRRWKRKRKATEVK